MALKDDIKDMIIEELHLGDTAPGSIVDDAPLFGEGLGLDSLDALQLAVAVEERFGVRISDEAHGTAAFASVIALTAFIQEHRG